jgi:predicted Zn-dependent protease
MVSSEVGKTVVADGNVAGDRITLWSNALLKGALGSARFDSYGTPGRRVCLIEDNLLRAYAVDKRYADYLKLPVTGELANIEVASGLTAFDSLRDPAGVGAPVLYHLQAFSAFEPNAITGAFSAEIRAGYEISTKGVRPIKGGSVSGVLHRDLLDCRLSKERVQRERLLAPKGLLFSKLTIAGE